MPFTICPICGEKVCHPKYGFFCRHDYARRTTRAKVLKESLALIEVLGDTDPVHCAIKKAFREAEIFQDAAELLWLFDAIKDIGIVNVLEIGAWQGGTSILWSEAFGGEVVSVDIEPKEPYAGNRDNLIIGDSHSKETLAKVYERRSSFDMVFIDGDHSLESVTADYMLYAPFCRDGGVIVFHDIVWDKPTVGAFFDSLPGRKESFSTHLGIGVLFK